MTSREIVKMWVPSQVSKNKACLNVRLLDRPHHNAAVDGSLSLQSPQDQDAHAGVKLELGARLYGQGDARHDRQVGLDDVGPTRAVQQGEGVV